ncbi:DUF5696 domain-containing protein [Paenibacillus sp. GCM10023250]|uniref:DUF5696 domain-containing protein n=1 Tax=Paenibacillus sp. GCM10023250 TaxID=3252648 RepID=UPI0036236F1E
MAKRKQAVRIGLGLAAIALAGSIAHAFGETPDTGGGPAPGASLGDREEQAFFRSNRFTMPEPARADVPKTAVGQGYTRIGENAGLELYMNMATCAIAVKNKATGYVWSSLPDPKTMGGEELNEDWLNAMQSPFLFDYFQGDDATPASSNYRSQHGKALSAKPVQGGMDVTYALPDLGITFTVRTLLDEQGLVVSVPDDAIAEKGSGRLAAVQLYPFLGSVRQADVPGYLFIPDGSGALIRFRDQQSRFDEPYVGEIYGSDAATTGFDFANAVSYPVFGIVHGAGQNALMGIVEQGKANAEIVAYPSGVNTNYYWVSPRFKIRSAYFQPTSQSMGGINTFTKARTEGDKSTRYVFLSGREADYAGMAAAYRAYLQRGGLLPEQPKPAASDESRDVPVEIDFLGGDIEPGLIGRHVLKLTSFEEAKAILEDLRKQGVTRVTAVLKGWNSGGLNGARPAKPVFASELGGRSGFEALRDYAAAQGIALSLETDYTDLLKGSPRTDVRSDATRMITDRLLEYPFVSKFVSSLYKDLTGYYLRPQSALRLAKDDFGAFRGDGLTSLALNGTGSTLFSDYGGKTPLTRTGAMGTYGKLLEEADKQSLRLLVNRPNDYMLKGTSAYLGMPLESSQFMYATDTVPFVEMVLHGVVDYYASDANHQADPEEDVLRMIEYGAYPSFVITKEPSWKLQNTPSSDQFSTAYDDWAPEIKRRYDLANEALKPVQGAYMTGREVPEYGIVKVSYSSGATIWVNYTGRDYRSGAVTVKARGYTVTGGGEP